MTTSVISAVTAVFTAVMEWIITAITAVIGVFWAESTGLTFLGVLALVALGIAIFLLILNLIKDFLHLR